MSSHNIRFCGQIRKKLTYFGRKKTKNPYMDIGLDKGEYPVNTC